MELWKIQRKYSDSSLLELTKGKKNRHVNNFINMNFPKLKIQNTEKDEVKVFNIVSFSMTDIVVRKIEINF